MDQDSQTPRSRFTVFGGGSYSESLRIGPILRKETVGVALLVAAASVALVWANSPISDSHFQLRDVRFGYLPRDLELSLVEWASEGLLAIFFFLVGLGGSLLVAELSFGHGSTYGDLATAGLLVASLIASLLAAGSCCRATGAPNPGDVPVGRTWLCLPNLWLWV